MDGSSGRPNDGDDLAQRRRSGRRITIVIAPYELAAGLVARFDPAQLVANGGAPDRRLDLAVAGPHYFVCLGRCGRYSVWTPAFTRYRLGRERIGWKAGLPDWVDQDSFVDL